MHTAQHLLCRYIRSRLETRERNTAPQRWLRLGAPFLRAEPIAQRFVKPLNPGLPLYVR